MSAESYTLAYSPCPNDTYIFAALTNGLLTDAPKVRVHLADIQELNDAASRGAFDLVKVSYGAIPYLTEKYRILRSGGALGRGCGPLVIAKPGAVAALDGLRDKRIAIPGERTTAFMLLQLALGMRPNVEQRRFDQIVPAVAADEFDAGVIIHESRFTYPDAGLAKVVDLGDWWESVTGMPIPLGAILVRREIGEREARDIDRAIQASLAFSRINPSRIMRYVREHAFEMSDDVMRAHIELYVNEFSDDIGSDGIAAVRELFSRAKGAGVIDGATEPEFV